MHCDVYELRCIVQAGILTANNGAAIGQVGQQTGARIRMIDPMPGTEEHIAIISSSNDLLAGAEDTNAAQVLLLLAPSSAVKHSPHAETSFFSNPPKAWHGRDEQRSKRITNSHCLSYK